MIAQSVEGRTAAQCNVRWTRSLVPGLKRGAWKEEEDVVSSNFCDVLFVLIE